MQHSQPLQQILCGCLYDGYRGYICRGGLSELWVAFQAFQYMWKRSSNSGKRGQDGGVLKYIYIKNPIALKPKNPLLYKNNI